MSRDYIERMIRERFQLCKACALVAALNEVEECFKCEECMRGVLLEMGSSMNVNDALIQWSIHRGELWL